MNTKYFAVLFFIVSAAAVDLIDPFHDSREECRQKAGLTVEQLASAPQHMEIAGPYLICFAGKLGVLEEGGLINVDKIASVVAPVVPPNIATLITADCNCQASKSSAKTSVERIVAFAKCLAKELPKDIISATGYFNKPFYPPLDHDTCSYHAHGHHEHHGHHGHHEPHGHHEHHGHHGYHGHH